ncbi:SDR family NAD(P)-dependent oxidoreductase [Streptomyces alkaliphilus]|uniref:SDR family oxidoreductase n=1 Tax=Streptomyces alkaliphilus TaxID=1472722 RepID=A0A7W3TCC0_9ACTN|nr:3-oxoacyl-ACP reductase family protein [Streptomyces alkaliphilus]MBB0244055.1 SDR family oxidoreductase [Streptomyces alkaliphilus]MQS07449.1 SDR family oxidoreductase [Streptomyces alkaliphilus]
MELGLAGKNALVTGGSRGIGRAVVLALAKAGATVVTCYRQEGEAVDSLARELKEIGGEHLLVRADVGTVEGVERLMEACRSRFDSLDVLVNNAGVISQIPFSELPLEEWERVLATNLTGPFLVIGKALPMLREGSSVINVGSRGAMAGIPLRGHYTASKAGLVGLTRSLCKELGGRGIRFNVVAPGVIDTSEPDELSEEERAAYNARYLRMMALGRFGRPEEIAGAVLFLAGDLSSYVNGETLHVDGGV